MGCLFIKLVFIAGTGTWFSLPVAYIACFFAKTPDLDSVIMADSPTFASRIFRD